MGVATFKLWLPINIIMLAYFTGKHGWEVLPWGIGWTILMYLYARLEDAIWPTTQREDDGAR